MGSSRGSNLVDLHSNTPAHGFALTLLPTIHSGALFKSFFGLDPRQGTPPCLPRNNLQFWCMRNSLGFSRIPQLAWVQDQGCLKGWEPGALCHSPQGIHSAVLQAFQFLPSSQHTHTPTPLAWPQVHPLSYQHSAKLSHVPGLLSWTPRGPGVKKKGQ